MNRFIKTTTVALALACFSTLTWASTTILTVNGMVCAFCAQGIEKRLSKLPETKGVFVDLKNKIVAIETKDGMVLDTQMLQAEVKDVGYDVIKIENSHHSLEEIKAGLHSNHMGKGQK
jgi:copper chaperone CopZ